MDPKVAEKFAQALAECAVRQNHAGLRKEAAAYKLIKQAEGDLRASPYIYGPAIGALLGGAGGYFSDDDEKKKLRNILYGVGIGGLSGLGVAGLTQWLNQPGVTASLSPTVPVKTPVGGDNKPAGNTNEESAAGNKPAENTSLNASGAETAPTVAAGATLAGGLAGLSAPPPPRYSLDRHARELRRGKNVGDATQATALAGKLERLNNIMRQTGGKPTDRQLLGLSDAKPGPLRQGQVYQAEQMRRMAAGTLDYQDFAAAAERMRAATGNKTRQLRADVTPGMYNAARRVSVPRRSLYGALAAAMAGFGANTIQNSGAGQALGDAVGSWLAPPAGQGR